jgi:hypothetical protein
MSTSCIVRQRFDNIKELMEDDITKNNCYNFLEHCEITIEDSKITHVIAFQVDRARTEDYLNMYFQMVCNSEEYVSICCQSESSKCTYDLMYDGKLFAISSYSDDDSLYTTSNNLSITDEMSRLVIIKAIINYLQSFGKLCDDILKD